MKIENARAPLLLAMTAMTRQAELTVCAEAIGVVFVAGSAAYVIGRWIAVPANRFEATSIMLLLLLLLLDPYSFGASGGDAGLDLHRAQWITGGVEAALLAAILVTIRSRWWRAGLVLAMVELSIFVVANATYIARDGFWSRVLR